MQEEDDHDEDADDDADDDDDYDGCVKTHVGLGWEGVGGGGMMMTTLLRRHPEQILQKSHFALYSQYFRDVGPSCIVTKPTSGLCELDLGISEAKARTWVGGSLFGG